MRLSSSTSTEQLRQAFQEAFPLLNIKFYRVPHDHFQGSMRQDEISEDLALGKLNPTIPEADLPFDKTMTVDAFEHLLEKKFGLHVQVFRKSGSQWMQTSATDQWTLGKQLLVAEETEAFLRDTHQ